MSEQVLTEHIKEILASIKEDRKKLEDTVKTAKEKGNILMGFFIEDDTYPEFEKPQEFRVALADLSEQIGHALFMVLEIENKRQGIVQTFTKPKTEDTQKTPNVLVQSTPAVVQQPGGVSGWLGERTRAGSQEKQLKMLIEERAKQERPKITTEQQVTNILDFGRDLIPEFINRTHLYFQQCLDHLHFFNDDNTKRFYHGELSIHLNKLNGIIRSFCRTVAEYRKSVLDQIKMEIARGMTEVVTAQMLGQANVSISEWFKREREARGPTDFH